MTHKNIISLIREKEKEKTIVKTECLKKLIKIEKTGQRISETEILNEKDGQYQVYRGSKYGPRGSTDRWNTAKNTIIMGKSANVGYFQFIEKDCWVNDDNYIIEIIDSSKEINQKYLFYSLLNLEKEISQLAKISKNNIKYLTNEEIEKIYEMQIPIVPLEIQNEVVKILNGLKNLVNLV